MTPTITALKEALEEQQEPVVCKHEWFSTGAMETGQCRCIKCGVWNTAPQPPAPAPMQQEPVRPSAYQSLIRDMTTIAAREVPRGVPFAEFAMQALADAELREHDAAPQPAQLKPVFSYTPDLDAVRRDEKEKADKFLAQQAQRTWVGLTDEQKDAARYQHIKGMARVMSPDINGNHYWAVALHGIRGASLDEAIDRAIKAAHTIKEKNA